MKNFYLVPEGRITIIVLAFFLLITGCKKDSFNNSSALKQNIPSDVIEALKKAGFNTASITLFNDGYIVENDIYISKENIKELAAVKSLKIPSYMSLYGKEDARNPTQHYRSPYTLWGAAIYTREIKIYMGWGSGTYISDALDEAIDRYNALNLRIVFTRTSSSLDANIEVKQAYDPAYPGDPLPWLMSAGFPTSGGNPHNEIYVNLSKISPTIPTANVTYIFQHEIGHTIGLRHTDYMDRSYSCGGSPVFEGGSATHVSGTPTSPESASIMLSCVSSLDRNFSQWDIVALRSLYTRTMPIYVKKIMTLVSDDSYSMGACCDHVLQTWHTMVEFYQDAGFTIPYTTTDYFLLRIGSGSGMSPASYITLVPNG
ncbi:MAG: hypothetical protein EOO89_22425, partial [Pedobacter sp.]